MAVNKFLEKSLYTVRETTKAITEEEANYLRIINLVLRVAPQAVRVQFDKEFFPGKLQTVLNQNRLKVLDPLKRKRVINHKQWDLLYPRTGVASSNNFDLTLMICLIRNLTEISVGDLLQLPLDVSVGADLSRIKHYRNLVAHCDDGTISNQNFQDIWTEISLAVVRLGGINFQQTCNDLKVSTLDKNDMEILNEFRNTEGLNNPISKGFQEVIDNIILSWKILDEKVIETSAIQHLMELATTADIITVIGSPGCGKSTAVHHLALERHLHQDNDIIYSHNPIDLRNYYNPGRKQIFIFDDVYGKYILEQPKKEAWSNLLTEINMILQNKTVKIYFSCRTHIYNQIEKDEDDIICRTVFNLLSDEHALTVDERILMAGKYIPEDVVASLMLTEHFNEYDFFPLLCKLSSNKTSLEIEKLYTRPVDFIRQDLNSMLKLSDQTTVATLFLFVIYNNCLTKDLLGSKSEIRTILQDLSEEFKIPFFFSIKIVKQQLEFLIQSYVIETDEIYKVIHDKIFDIMISFFGQYMFDLILEYAHSDIIRDRFQFELIGAPESENMIIVSAEKEGDYLERLCTDIKKGNIENVFLNHQLQYQLFRTKLISFIETNKVDLAGPVSMHLNKQSSPLLIVTNRGYCDAIRMLIDMNLDINVYDEDQRTPLFIACWEGHLDVVKLLLNYKCNLEICNKHGMSALYAASWKGSIPIVKLLLERKCNMNIDEHKKWNPLKIAYVLGYSNIVEIMLQHNCFHYLSIFHPKSPFCISLLKKHSQLALTILRPTCCSDTCNKYIKSTLSIVLHKVHAMIFKSIVELLNEKGIDELIQYFKIDNIHEDVLTLLSLHKCYADCCDNILREYKLSFLIAIAYGYEDAVLELLKISIDVGSFSQDDKSPLLLSLEYENILNMLLRNNFLQVCKSHENLLCKAASQGFVKTVKLLLHYNVNTNDCNNFGESPLFLAIKYDNLDIVNLLVKSKADPNICNNHDQSPLYQAAHSDNVDIVKLLLQKKADPNRSDEHGVSPLHIAAKYNKLETVSILLAHGGNINVCNNAGSSPLSLAIEYGNADIVKLLKHNMNNDVPDTYKSLRKLFIQCMAIIILACLIFDLMYIIFSLKYK